MLSPSLSIYNKSHYFLGKGHAESERKMYMVIGLCTVSMIVEVTCGTLFGSLAVVADGIHMGTHVSAFAITAFAYYYATKHADDNRFVFGTGKVGELAAFTSAIVLAFAGLLILVEAIDRLVNPKPLEPLKAIGIACIGLFINILSAILLGECNDSHNHGEEGGMAHGHSHSHGHQVHQYDYDEHDVECGGDGHSHGHDHGHGTNSPMHENTSSHTHDHSSGDGGHDHDHSHESGHSHDHSHGGKPPPEFYGNTHKHGDESVHIQSDDGVVVLSVREKSFLRIEFEQWKTSRSLPSASTFSVTTSNAVGRRHVFRFKNMLALGEAEHFYQSTHENDEVITSAVVKFQSSCGEKGSFVYNVDFREGSPASVQGQTLVACTAMSEESAGHDHDHSHTQEQPQPKAKGGYEMVGNPLHGELDDARGHDHGDEVHDHHHAHDHGHGGKKAKHEIDNNFRAAFIHVVMDAFVSVLVIVALAIEAADPSIRFLDPIVGMIGAFVILSWAWTLCIDTSQNLMDMNPDQALTDALRIKLESDGSEVTDMHVWRLGPGHLGTVVSVIPSAQIRHKASSAYYNDRMKGFRALSHVTVEILEPRGASLSGFA